MIKTLPGYFIYRWIFSEHKDLWQEYKFSIIEKSSYKINDEFPRINQSSFVNSSIPDSISNKIRYRVE